jgi:D-proline reductase (dithiol) PrdB
MTADQDMRAFMATLPVPTLEGHPYTQARPLAESTVAVVTTAGLHLAEESNFGIFDPGYRVIPHGRDDVVMSHNSQNFDRSGVMLDRNVAFPVDRLAEMAADGTIGAVAPNHVSFMGAQEDLSTILLDTGPGAARFLLEQGTDVVLLTPV